ncbi:hypothetical protein LXL04_011144 [Taraxacum kok-saghyz]
MMSFRFIIISSLLFFVIATTLFTGFRCKGGNNDGLIATSAEEVRPKNVYVVAAPAATREKTLVDYKKLKMNVMPIGKHTTFRRLTVSRNKNENFVAFTEDYHKPRHHPPKNN